jgi:hypothetical protein
MYASVIQPLTDETSDYEEVATMNIITISSLFFHVPKAITQYSIMVDCAIRGEEIDWNRIV